MRLAEVEPVLEEMRQRADTKADAAAHAAVEPGHRHICAHCSSSRVGW
jgi:hypothetical protein